MAKWPSDVEECPESSSRGPWQPKVPFARLDGSMNHERRVRALETFNSQPHVQAAWRETCVPGQAAGPKRKSIASELV